MEPRRLAPDEHPRCQQPRSVALSRRGAHQTMRHSCAVHGRPCVDPPRTHTIMSINLTQNPGTVADCACVINIRILRKPFRCVADDTLTRWFFSASTIARLWLGERRNPSSRRCAVYTDILWSRLARDRPTSGRRLSHVSHDLQYDTIYFHAPELTTLYFS